MNAERMQRLEAHLRNPTTAEHFDMRFYSCRRRVSDGVMLYNDPADMMCDDPANMMSCDTVGCIAGHAIYLFNPNFVEGHDYRTISYYYEAKTLLSLTEDEAWWLFRKWPVGEERNNVAAADRVRRMIEGVPT